MALTYEPIATTTLAATSTSVIFSSIPSTYSDLRLILSGSGYSATENNSAIWIRFNDDATNSYIRIDIEGTGSGVSAATFGGLASRIYINGYITTGPTLTKPSFIDYNLLNYSSTSLQKTGIINGFVNTNNGAAGGIVSVASTLWASTSAINKIDLRTAADGTGYWLVGTTATLYGIKRA